MVVLGLDGVGKHGNSDENRIRLLFELMRILSISEPPTPRSHFATVGEPPLPLAFLQVLEP